jgi:hypothetical protein
MAKYIYRGVHQVTQLIMVSRFSFSTGPTKVYVKGPRMPRLAAEGIGLIFLRLAALSFTLLRHSGHLIIIIRSEQ